MRMNIEELRVLCLSMKAVTEGLPFDENTLVFSVKGKMFCLTDIDNFESINVKCDPDEAIVLRERYEGVSPGYHMSKKHWNTVKMNNLIPDHMIEQWIQNSYNLVVAGLPKKVQKELADE